jgi:hypothetical protein
VIATVIVKLQNIQRRNPPTSQLWEAASRDLNSLYAKVATLPKDVQLQIARETGMILPKNPEVYLRAESVAPQVQ